MLASASGLVRGLALGVASGLAPVPTSGGDDPFSMFSSWDSGQLLWLAVLVPVAVLVFYVGSKRFRSQLGASSITPRGRDRFVSGGGGPRRDASWRSTVERLEAQPATAIAKATSGPVRIEAEVVGASGNLGGTPGRECVWRNRAGAGTQTAVGADLVIIADASGRCGIERLEQARVAAPTEKTGAHYESVSLYVGDRIEVIARFDRELVGEHDDPAMLVYGTLGTEGPVDVRVLQRPEPAPVEPEGHDEPAPAESDPSDDEP
ncbi:MAG: hypothetical protein AB1Z98_10210 [Nannocystaceae bacterium]